MEVGDLDPNIGRVVANYDDLPVLEPSGCMSQLLKIVGVVTRYPGFNTKK